MAMPIHSHWDDADAIRRGQDATRLIADHPDVVAGLAPNVATQIVEDRAILGDNTAKLTAQKVATGAKHDVERDAHDLVIVIRNVLSKSHAADAAHEAAGTGDGLKIDDTAGILAALRAITANATLMSAAGVSAGSLNEAHGYIDALSGTKGSQESAFGARKSDTATRRRAHLRLEANIAAVEAQGVQAYRTNKPVRAEFEKLTASTGSAPAPQKKTETAKT